MDLNFNDKRISGILTILPENEIKFEDEVENYNFSVAKSQKLKKTMGYNTRRIVDGKVCISDLAIFGLSYLFESDYLKKEEIDAIILVTQTPDYFMPPTSNVIQGHFKLKNDIICLDINQGCAGFLIGLQQAFMLLDQKAVNKVVLINADVISRKVSKRDRNSNPLIGDGASITIVEKSLTPTEIFSSIYMDGQGAMSLMIPAGGMRIPSSLETSQMVEDVSGNFRALDHLVMKGDDVFNFVQREVPPMIEELLSKAKLKKGDIDHYLFHQPNKFMLDKLADKIGVERTKMPSNIVGIFGNSSGVSIPLVIAYNLGELLCKEVKKVCLAGFGVGLTWGAMVIDIGDLNFNKIINFK